MIRHCFYFSFGIILFLPLVVMASGAASRVSPQTEAEKQKIELKREEINQQRKKAATLNDAQTLVILDNLDNYLEIQSLCFNKNEDLEIDICLLSALKESANSENFIAQHYMGNMFERSYQNNKMAIFWYEKALNNTKTPEIYKQEVLKDLERVNKKTAPENGIEKGIN